MQPFEIQSIVAGSDCAVLRISGEIDIYTAPELRECVINLIDSGTVHLVVDLRGVVFLDSTGLGALVGSLKRVRTRDGSLKLVTSRNRILEVFRITGLHKVFALDPSVPDAIATDPHWQAAVAGEDLSIDDWCRKHTLL